MPPTTWGGAGRQGLRVRLLRLPGQGGHQLPRPPAGGLPAGFPRAPQEGLRRRGVRQPRELPLSRQERNRELREEPVLGGQRQRTLPGSLSVRRRQGHNHLPGREGRARGQPQSAPPEEGGRRLLPRGRMQRAPLHALLQEMHEGPGRGLQDIRGRQGRPEIQAAGRGEPPVSEGNRDEGQPKHPGGRRLRHAEAQLREAQIEQAGPRARLNGNDA